MSDDNEALVQITENGATFNPRYSIGEILDKLTQASVFWHQQQLHALWEQRDELLEALEMMLEMSEMGGFGKAAAEDVARAAIAKVKGE